MAQEGNGYHSNDDLPDIDIEESGETGSAGGTSPGVKGLFIQPFPGGGHQSNPIDRFMVGSNKPAQFIALTNVNDHEISRDERIMYVRNIVNFGNGKMEDIIMFGYNLRRARNGQTQRDVVQMISGQRQQQQREWEGKQNRVFNQARSNNPLKGSSEMVGG
jgi:hypothetical protein